MYEHQSRQVDCGSANDGLLDEEAPDLGPLRETAEAAELAEATAGLTDGSGAPLPAEEPLRPLACAVARALTEAGFTLHHCARHHLRHRLGGVCLLPVAAGHVPESNAGVVVSWTTHDLLSLDWCRWPEYHGIQQVMNGALGQVLGVLGFQIVLLCAESMTAATDPMANQNRRLGAHFPWAAFITYRDGSSRVGLSVVGRLVGRAPAASPCNVCFLCVCVWHPCR